MGLACVALMLPMLMLSACGAQPAGAPESGGVTVSSAQTPSRPGAAPPADTAPVEDRLWARQALQVLDTVDAAVRDYHASTDLPYNSARALQLRQSAYAGFKQAVTEHQALLATTQQVRDASDRDQYMFVLGNIGGFLTPSPDLAGDSPSLGDRIARSLDNAIAGSAALRPRLDRLATLR